jgi:hypothetical protein
MCNNSWLAGRLHGRDRVHEVGMLRLRVEDRFALLHAALSMTTETYGRARFF